MRHRAGDLYTVSYAAGCRDDRLEIRATSAPDLSHAINGTVAPIPADMDVYLRFTCPLCTTVDRH